MAKKAIIIKIDGVQGKYCRTCYDWKPLSEYHKYQINVDSLFLVSLLHQLLLSHSYWRS